MPSLSFVRPSSHISNRSFRITVVSLLALSCADEQNPATSSSKDAAVDAMSPDAAAVDSTPSTPTSAANSSAHNRSYTGDDAGADTSHVDTTDRPKDLDSGTRTQRTTAPLSDATATVSDTESDASTVHEMPDGGSLGASVDAEADGATTEIVACDRLPEAPVPFAELTGYTRSEDFVFDAQGNYVGVDTFGNLVRIPKGGAAELWMAGFNVTAGIAILPDGSVIVCDVTEGALKRVHENGYVQTLLGGLEYPNGIDVGPDGFLYVAENFAGRVRRVDPDSGDYSIVAIGLHGPNGIAFGDDPHLMYVGSFEGSGVYKVEFTELGKLGIASVFARPNGSTLPEPELLCPDQEVGVECTLIQHAYAECQKLGDVVDCLPADVCAKRANGSTCYYPQPGFCEDGVCSQPCEGLDVWAPCSGPDGQGVCRPVGDLLECKLATPCDGLDQGDVCVDPNIGGEGICVAYASQNLGLVCVDPLPCTAKAVGDECTDPNGNEGHCYSEHGILTCGEGPPCADKQAGDDCEIYGNPGKCESTSATLACIPLPICASSNEGDSCIEYGVEGLCRQVGPTRDYMYCIPNACEDLAVGADCTDSYHWTTGTCIEVDSGLLCDFPEPCDESSEGDDCFDDFSGTDGACVDEGEGLYCRPNKPCDELSEGDACFDSYSFEQGICTTSETGLECIPTRPCSNQELGDSCQESFGTGVCLEYFGELSCVPPYDCSALSDGSPCTSEGGSSGTCQARMCTTIASPGGIDGLGVDACGNVYASEYTNGHVYRISPAGQIELLVDLPSGWIPNIKWGRGLGGFSKNVMYVADRDESRLFAIEVGVPGAKEFYDMAQE